MLKAVISSPFATQSGYGHHAREIITNLIERKGNDWDIKILPQKWGNTPWGFIQNNPEWEFLNEYIQPNHQLTSQPDYMFWNTIPSEGQIVGKHSRDNDLTVNACKGKKLTNMRASGSDPSTALQPHLQMTLEQCLSFITDDELIEFTPKSIRLRKMLLNEGERKRNKKN